MPKCPACGALYGTGDSFCPECGRRLPIAEKPEKEHGKEIPKEQATPQNKKKKSKVVAGLLALFLGGLGIHKFYLGRIGMGILYIAFCWTYIPGIIGFIEGIIYLTRSDEEFEAKYVK